MYSSTPDTSVDLIPLLDYSRINDQKFLKARELGNVHHLSGYDCWTDTKWSL